MDLSNEQEPRSIDPPDSRESLDSGSKSCADCRTTKTPLWRGGPDGPKSLCNACGIRYRKKRREVKGMEIKMKELGLKKKTKKCCELRVLGEEEQAAFVLMTLSSGLLYTYT